MAHVADHLSIEELEQRYRACEDACSARHYQTIWLLAQGHTIAAGSALTSFVPRWIEDCWGGLRGGRHKHRIVTTCSGVDCADELLAQFHQFVVVCSRHRFSRTD